VDFFRLEERALLKKDTLIELSKEANKCRFKTIPLLKLRDILSQERRFFLEKDKKF
jgi:hypothetical protein